MSITEEHFVQQSQEANEKRIFDRIGIFDETDRLRKTVLYGPPGAEAYLAQLYPKRKSLFFDDMDVSKARDEYEVFQRTLEILGIDIISARDTLAKYINPQAVFEDRIPTRDELLTALYNRADDIIRGNQKDRADNPNDYLTPYKLDYIEKLAKLLDADIARYGLEKALALNYELSLNSPMPLGNLIYARDQMAIMMDRRIIASMKKDIRRKEIPLYEFIYDRVLGFDNPFRINLIPDPQLYAQINAQLQGQGVDSFKSVVTSPEGETYEGGDHYILDGVVYQGVGARTSFGAAIQVFQELKEDLVKYGYRFAIVYDEDAANRPDDDQMRFMHLDTWSYTAGKREMELYSEEAKKRRVIFVESDEHGNFKLVPTGKNYYQFLLDEGYKLYEIPQEEQQDFGCNNLYVGNLSREEIEGYLTEERTEETIESQGCNPVRAQRAGMRGVERFQVLIPLDVVPTGDTIIMPIDTNTVTINKLLEGGKTLILVPLKENTRGYGAAHCMNGQLLRAN